MKPSLNTPTTGNELDIEAAYARLADIVEYTPLQKNLSLSSFYNSEIFLKREDLQIIRSYKIRGAYNKILSLSEDDRHKGVVCASAGNHAQGVAWACHHLGIHATIFMPQTTPDQKIQRVALFGGKHIEITIVGDNFDESYESALLAAKQQQKAFVHPFDDLRIVEGQGTVGYELHEQIKDLDYVFIPVGGGGLSAGLGTYFKTHAPDTLLIGVEPEGAPAMQESMNAGRSISLPYYDTFVDGAAVKKVGDLTFSICREVLDDIITVPEGLICSTILKLYNEDAIVAEPAGAMSIAALATYKEKIIGKKVACIVSGGNNDVMRMEDIKERSLLYEGLKHYFIIKFPQRSGALKDFLDVLGPNDDITHFEYTKKHNRETGPALVGIELKNKSDFQPLVERMKKNQIHFQPVNDDPLLFEFLI
jgi:threonine dehydratase